MNETRDYKSKQLSSEIETLRSTDQSKLGRKKTSSRKDRSKKASSKSGRMFDSMDQEIAYNNLVKES